MRTPTTSLLAYLPLLLIVAAAPACKPTPIDTGTGDADADTDVDTGTIEECNNNVDDDLDGDKDCADSDCTVACTPTTIRLVTFSDWHGQLDPTTITVNATTVPPTTKSVGGAAVLSAYFDQERATVPEAVLLTAGDSFGGTPPLSSFFNDEPAIDALNMMGLQADTFGNHNFDHGLPFMQHLIDRADYPFVSANLTNLSANLTGVDAPFTLVDVGPTRIALIGITNPDAAALTFPGNMGTMVVQDPATRAIAARALAEDAGATVFVVLSHMGATGGTADAPTGPLIDLAHSLTGFQVIVGDHTDFQTKQTINGQAVVENLSKGLSYARIDLTLVPATGVVTNTVVTFVDPVWQTNGPAGLATVITPDATIDAMLAPLRSGLTAIYDGPIATTTGIFERDGTKERLMEMPIGDLTCDAFRARYSTQLCFINGGGVRAPIPSSYAPANLALRRNASGYASGPPYDVVIGDIYAVQPFGNTVVTRTITGTQLWSMLEHGFSSLPAKAGFFPQISGFKVVYDVEAPVGSRVVSVTLLPNTPILRNATTYTLATTNFLNAGGDGYIDLADGQGVTRELDAVVLQQYVDAANTITPVTDGRITENGPAGPVGPAVTSVKVAGVSTMDVVVSGGTGVFKVTLASAAPTGGTVVTLSSASAAVTVPASVTVLAGATTATFRVKAVATVATPGVVITATSPGGASAGTVNVVLDGVAPVYDSIVINEFNFDPPSDNTATTTVIEGDYNCDGSSTSGAEYKDEFVEIVNTTNKAVKLDGVSFWDDNGYWPTPPALPTPTYVIGANIDLGPGEPLVIMGAPVGASGISPWCAGASATKIGDARVLSVGGTSGLSLNNTAPELLYVLTNSSDLSDLLAGVDWWTGITPGQSEVIGPDEGLTTSLTYTNHAAMIGAIGAPYTATPGLYATGRKFADASLP